jgi:hypothetical protein
MQDKELLELYANGIIKNLRPNIRKDIDINLIIHPAFSSGGVVEVELEPRNKKNKTSPFVIKEPKDNIGDVLENVPQSLIKSNFNDVTFEGTNISMENNRIVFIKGDNDHWSSEDAIADISKIVNVKVEKLK